MPNFKLTRRSFLGGALGFYTAGSSIFRAPFPVYSQDESFLPVRRRLTNPFTENGKPVAVIVRGDDFAGMLAKGLEVLGGLSRFGNDKSVIVKPNFILPNKTNYPVTSDPGAVMTVVEFLQKEGFGDVTVADSRNIEDGKPAGMFKWGGINDKAALGGFRTDGLRDGEVVQVGDSRWEIMPRVGVYKKIYEAQLVISMPTVKQHLMTGYTCSLKNNMGTIDEWSCMHMHLWGDEHHKAFEALSEDELNRRLCLSIAEISSAVNPELLIVDARKVLGGSHLDKPAGTVCEADRLILCGDPLAAEYLAVEIFKEVYEPLNIGPTMETFRRAAELGLGVRSREGMVIKEAAV
jgi:uncharacterized protein (DUF362 family)